MDECRVSDAPDTALASVISTILVTTAHQSIGKGIVIAIPLAAAGQALTIFVRTITVFFIHRADNYASNCLIVTSVTSYDSNIYYFND